MTSWAKNQIAKQLARFVKNLDPSQISLKFLKGEGELLNLELNEKVLTELLELPPWLQLKKAICNRICAKIHWTSLKTDPIRLFLDCVEVEIFASENVAPKPKQASPQHHKQPRREKPQIQKASKYGFAEKVVDGMFVSINSVIVAFKAPGFKASCNMSRITIQSTDQNWNVPNNLRKTRIKDEQREQVLNFKEIKWGTMRLDADAAYVETSEHGSIPIRLITNNSAIHLTIKKSLNDCSLVSSRLEIILDDILWILTQSQLLKLSSFVHYILRVRQKFLPMATHTEMSKDHMPPPGGHSAQNVPKSPHFQGQGHGSSLSKLFTEHDVAETSYHVKTNQIDLHLCDDQTLSGKSNSNTKREKRKGDSSEQSGALLVSIQKLGLDHYPYHIAGLKRKLGRNDDDALFSRKQWAQQLFDFFLRNEGKKINQIAHILSKQSGVYKRPMMYESFFLISCSKFAIMQVSTADRQEPQAFLSSDKESLFLPDDMDSFLLDFTSYYFIGYRNLPVPPSNMFLKMNPMKLIFHPLTCVWLNKFIQSVIAGFEWTKEFMASDAGPPEHLDIRIECMMPQVSIPCESDSSLSHQEERPKALQIQISQAVISNSRIGVATSQSDLLMDVQKALTSKIYSKCNEFPNTSADYAPLPNDYWVNDYSIVHSRFLSAYQKSGIASMQHKQTENEIHSELPKKSPIFHSKEDPIPRVIWCIWCEQIWVDFIGIKKSFGRPVTLIDAVPIRLWLSFPVIFDKALSVSAANELSASYTEPTSYRNGSIPNGDTTHALREAAQRPLVKTDSTVSLPASFHSSAIASTLSNTSSSSSISTESAISTHESEAATEQTVGTYRSADKRPIGGKGEQSTPEVLSKVHLRTSYSDTDLIPHADLESSSDQTNLHDFQAQKLVVDGAGPPPPYFLSQSAESKVEQNPVGLTELLPPTYSQLPSYQCALETETDLEAPPLPRKEGQKEVVDFLVGNVENNASKECMSAQKVKLPTIGSILQIANQTSIQIDHFQLVFLMRLQEMFTDVASRILSDTMHFKTLQSPVHKETTEPSCFSLHISLPSVDVNIILPPTEEVHNEQLLSLEDRISSGKLTRFISLLQPKPEKPEVNGHVAEADISKSEERSSTIEETLSTVEHSGAVLHIEASNSTNDRSSNSVGKISNEMKSSQLQDGNLNDGSNDAESEKFDELKRDAAIDQPPAKIIVNENSLFETQTSFAPLGGTIEVDCVTKFDVPENPADHVRIVDETDDESDMEGTEACAREEALLDVCESESNLRYALKPIDTSEIGTQTEKEMPKGADYETYRDENVSVVCLKCKDIRVAVQSENENLLLKVVVEKVNLIEKGNITYGMTLDHRLSAERKQEIEEPIVSESGSQVMVRLLSGPSAKGFGDDAVQLGFAHVKVKDLQAQLHLGNAENLSEFVEDEYLMKRMPFKVELDNLQLKLIDNKARRYLSAPLPPPLEIRILNLLVNGAANGRITLGHNGFPELVRKEGQNSTPELLNENMEGFYEDELLYKEANGAKKQPENRGVILENERLIDDLKLANARLVSLEQERDAILKVVDKLQQELMWSNHENEKLLEKLNGYKSYLKSLNRR